MEADANRLDRLLSRGGAAPPGVALDVVIALLDRTIRDGTPGLRPERIRIDDQGRLQSLDPPGVTSKADILPGLGALLFEMTTGNTWLPHPDDQKGQLVTARRILSMWPAGDEVARFLQELTNPNTGVSFNSALAQVRGLRERVGGITLADWVNSTLRVAKAKSKPTLDDFDSPDNLTGSFPAGALAAIANQKKPEPSVKVNLPEASEPSKTEMEQMLRNLGGTQKTPLPGDKPKRRSGGGMAAPPWWVFASLAMVLMLFAIVLVLLLLR